MCVELYSATRGLLAATTAAQLTATVIGFVTAVGGWVEPGVPRHRPGVTAVDVSVAGDETFNVAVDTLSVAGLIIEDPLLALLVDARHALTRLQQAPSQRQLG